MNGTSLPTTQPRSVRIMLGLLAMTGLVVGTWALFAPHSFYGDFPGGGRHWISVEGPYNEHLVRDVGGLYLALGVVAVLAAKGTSVGLARAAALGWLVFSVPHLVFHLAHLADLDSTVDQVANVVSLGGAVVLAAAILVVSQPPRSLPSG